MAARKLGESYLYEVGKGALVDMKTVQFVGETQDKKFCFVFQDEEKENYYLDEDVCRVSGLSPLIYDQLATNRSFLVRFEEKSGVRYIVSIALGD